MILLTILAVLAAITLGVMYRRGNIAGQTALIGCAVLAVGWLLAVWMLGGK